MDKRWISITIFLCVSPLLQGAGCRTHYSARLQGTVASQALVSSAQKAKTVRVIYRSHAVELPQCADDWAPCLRVSEHWRALRECDLFEPKEGKRAAGVLEAKTGAFTFDACTHMVGVDYRADVAAYLDLDGNGRLDVGEPYGVYADNPLSRDKEPTAKPMKISIDRVLAGQ